MPKKRKTISRVGKEQVPVHQDNLQNVALRKRQWKLEKDIYMYVIALILGYVIIKCFQEGFLNTQDA